MALKYAANTFAGRYFEYMSWMRFLVPPGVLVLAVLSTTFFGACHNKQCHAKLCQGCCSKEGLCMEGNTLEACGVQGEACMRCNRGQTCAVGICLGQNPNAYPGSGDSDDDNTDLVPTSALWWLEDKATLHRYVPELAFQTSFPFSFPVAFWDASPQGKRWAAMLAVSETRYEVVHAFDNSLRPLHTGDGVPQKIAFAQDSRGLAFLIAHENSQGQLFWLADESDSPQRLSFAPCGFQDSKVNVLDFAWSPDSSALAVLALLGDGEVRAGIWVLTTTQSSACAAVVHPDEAEVQTSEWGAFGPLHWGEDNTLYFRASLLHLYPLQLYSFALGEMGGVRNPLLSGSTSFVLDFALSPSSSMLALLQENLSLSLLSPSALHAPSLAEGCETQVLAATQAMLFSPKNDWLLLVGHARSQLLHLEKMQCSLTSTPKVSEALWSPDGSFLAELSCAHSADCFLVIHHNNGNALLNPRIVSMGFQHLSQLRWTAN